MLIDLIALIANIVALTANIATIIYIVRKKLKSIVLLLLQISNVITQSIAISLYFGGSHDTKHYSFLIASELCVINIFLISLIDCDILAAFSILNPAITPKRIAILRGILISLFVVMFGTLFVLDMMGIKTPSWLFNIISIFTSGIFALIVVLYDNVQAIYLAFLVLRVSGNALSKKELAKRKYRGIVIANVFIVALDMIGVLGDNLFVFSGNPAYALVSIASVGVHSSLLLLVVSNLQRTMAPESKPLNISTKLTDFTSDFHDTTNRANSPVGPSIS